MHPLVIKAYSELGYKVHVGNNMSFSAKILDDNNKSLDAGGGMCVEDIAFWMFLSTIWNPKSMYIIGNALGYSALNMAAIFTDCAIDVIDAEIEGSQNQVGSTITRSIANKYFHNLELFIGFSPQDLSSCRRNQQQTYDCCIVDGLHHPVQLKKDFRGIKSYLSSSSLVYFHDAGTFNLYLAVEELAKEYKDENWKYYKLDFVPFGVAILCRNLPITIERWMESLHTPIIEWRNTPATDNAMSKTGYREPLIYDGNLYNPTLIETDFCPNSEINAFRLALLHCNYKNVIIYGARGRIADIIIEFINNNYPHIDFIFIDRALVNQKINHKWIVTDFSALKKLKTVNIIITGETSGSEIKKSIEKENINGNIYPIYDISDPVWSKYKNEHLKNKK